MKSFPALCILFMGSLLFSSFTLWAQAPIAVKANDFVTTTIFFPSNIKKVIAPGANFQFNYEEGANIGLLKGRKGKASNLLVITEQGYVYSFALSYAEEVTEFNFILKTDQAITRNIPKNTVTPQDAEVVKVADKVESIPAVTNQNDKDEPVSIESDTSSTEEATVSNSNEHGDTPNQRAKMANTNNTLVEQNNTGPVNQAEAVNLGDGQDDLYDVDREEYYRIYCENNYLQKTSYKRSFRQNKRIAVRLNNILTDRNEKYFVLQIENNSKREYEVAGFSFFRKSDVGQLEKIMNPIYSFNLQETIDSDSVNEVVYVFENFKISSKEKIIVALADANSDNMVILPLDDLLINSSSN